MRIIFETHGFWLALEIGWLTFRPRRYMVVPREKEFELRRELLARLEFQMRRLP
jgi:hypothetical protein